MSKRRRSLSNEDKRLWAHVVQGVRPLPGKSAPDVVEAEGDTSPIVAFAPAALPSSLPVPNRPSLPSLASLEPRLRRGLRRRTLAVDSTIDLHGLRQEEAHLALIGFLRRSGQAGHGLVLVITGKGGLGKDIPLGHARMDDPFAARGVLRRIVPHWLSLPDLRPLVLGFEEASPHHGGSGALYVRLRRWRGAG